MRNYIPTAANSSTAQELVTNSSPYAPVPLPEGSEEEQTYTQSQITADLLRRLAESNINVLRSLRPNFDVPEFITSVKKPQTLHDIATVGADNHILALRVWDHLFKEITQPGTQPRPPTLIAIDNIDHWMGPTQYRTPDYTVIHAHQFVLIKQLLSLLFSNTQPLSHGGMVIGATTASNNPVYPSLSVLLKQITALGSGSTLTDPNFPMPSPYAKADARVFSLLNPAVASTTKITDLKGLSKHEAAGLLRYFTNSGILKEALTDNAIGEKWTLSSGGVVGQLCKLGSQARIDPEKVVTGFGTAEGVRVGQGLHRPKR